MNEIRLKGMCFVQFWRSNCMGETVNGNTFLDMLQIWLFPQLQEDSNNFVFQKDGAPPHWKLEVREFLRNVIPNRWIVRTGTDATLLHTISRFFEIGFEFSVL
ncbi:hypothetical protein AVEN_50873-1 [Araneus ventricosus]|uniref:Tc1-like transposase DDE domain-containing protein n=1 Tax=Araneus ventricosus TaxID=182803 RepID=A0A4Y2MAC1_ARAVE|nr:hypothetical protein AVEN_50873-1 [Araneus ventricosus]